MSKHITAQGKKLFAKLVHTAKERGLSIAKDEDLEKLRDVLDPGVRAECAKISEERGWSLASIEVMYLRLMRDHAEKDQKRFSN